MREMAHVAAISPPSMTFSQSLYRADWAGDPVQATHAHFGSIGSHRLLAAVRSLRFVANGTSAGTRLR